MPARKKSKPGKARKRSKKVEDAEEIEDAEETKSKEVKKRSSASPDSADSSDSSASSDSSNSSSSSPLKSPKPSEKSSLGKFFASINNIGMGSQRVSMIQSLAMMMNAGLPLIDALHTLEHEVRNKGAKKIVRSISSMVETGTPLWRAMKEQYLFSPYEIALVRIGEEAGNLARNMEYLSIQQEKDRALRSKVRMAMIYPTIVFVLMFIIVMGLGMFVLPNLIQVLISLNAELPATTRAVIFVTNLFTEYGAVAIPSMIGLFILLALLSKFTRFKAVTQWIIFHIPGVGALGKNATIARFGIILGGLLQAGVPLVEALRSLEDVTTIVSYKTFYGKLLEHISQGDSFSKSFSALGASNKLLPVSVQQLVVTGEQSGTLSNTLLKIAEIYEKKAEETAEKLPVILEPMLLLFIGGLVGTIAFSIITPIYGVVGNVGR